MNINSRIKELRKYLDLTQQDFADRLGIARNNIAGYETEKRSPSEAVISLVCMVFNVNENWLRTGEGDMFLETHGDLIERMMMENRHFSDKHREFLEIFLDMTLEEQDLMMDFVKTIVVKAGKWVEKYNR